MPRRLVKVDWFLGSCIVICIILVEGQPSISILSKAGLSAELGELGRLQTKPSFGGWPTERLSGSLAALYN